VKVYVGIYEQIHYLRTKKKTIQGKQILKGKYIIQDPVLFKIEYTY